MPKPGQQIPNRIFIYRKDVENISGLKERAARRLLSEIRKKYGKSRNGSVTIKEFCSYKQINEEEIIAFLSRSV